jgi:hypothetical protein
LLLLLLRLGRLFGRGLVVVVVVSRLLCALGGGAAEIVLVQVEVGGTELAGLQSELAQTGVDHARPERVADQRDRPRAVRAIQDRLEYRESVRLL